MQTETFTSKYLQQEVARTTAGKINRNWTLLLVFSVVGLMSLGAFGGLLYTAAIGVGSMTGVL